MLYIKNVSYKVLITTKRNYFLFFNKTRVDSITCSLVYYNHQIEMSLKWSVICCAVIAKR